MLEQISERLQDVMKFLRGEGKVTEKNMQEALKRMRMAFLEADVNYKVVKDFEARVKNKALDEKVLASLTPAQQVIKIVKDELTAMLGDKEQKLRYSESPPSVFMLVGLQGTGKTTTCGKLAKKEMELNHRPLLVSFDLKRPAAQEQLKTIAASLHAAHYEFSKKQLASPHKALKQVVQYAEKQRHNPLIVDTAGRLHIDDELMDELELVKKQLDPDEVIYIGDSMTGQDAVRSASAFEERIGLTSIILTKLDGDTRGGAALSITAVTGKPIKFIGVGEKFDKLQVFHPDRMASRIIGLGDMLSLIEKAEKETDVKQAEELAEKMKRDEFTLEDFKKQIEQVKKMGSLSQLLKGLPTGGAFKNINKMNIDDKKVHYFEAIINSMTPEERINPKIINGSRRKRIARGSGRPVSEVNQLIKQFFDMKKIMKKPGFKKMMSSFPLSH
ncbi:MAG: signal recognition particle protein [Candidatus Aminicenantes bacterium]|nr:signal recognition particle protein [Candidatus Aminicenantes bacterium]